MKYLLPGSESKDRVELLLKLTKMNSGSLKRAIYDHLVVGHSQRNAAELNGLPTQNLNRSISKLEEVAMLVEEIKEIDCVGYKANQLSGD